MKHFIQPKFEKSLIFLFQYFIMLFYRKNQSYLIINWKIFQEHYVSVKNKISRKQRETRGIVIVKVISMQNEAVSDIFDATVRNY